MYVSINYVLFDFISLYFVATNAGMHAIWLIFIFIFISYIDGVCGSIEEYEVW